jgi:hypothetical protein
MGKAKFADDPDAEKIVFPVAVLSDDEMKLEAERERILPELSWAKDAKKWFSDYNNRNYQDALLRNIVMAYSFAVPLHYRSLAIGIYNNIIEARERVSKFLYTERKSITETKEMWENFSKLAWGRAKNIIDVATREAKKNTKGYGSSIVHLTEQRSVTPVTPVTPLTPLSPAMHAQVVAATALPTFGTV